MQEVQKRYLTVREAAERLNIGCEAIRRRIRNGELPAYRTAVGKGLVERSPLRIDAHEFERWMRS
jgi:excisionase family DNA binding protein